MQLKEVLGIPKFMEQRKVGKLNINFTFSQIIKLLSELLFDFHTSQNNSEIARYFLS